MNIPILKELERLKTAHATAKVNSAVFQPDEQDQKALIYKNEQRREESKRIIEEKLKAADAKLLEQEQAKNKLAGSTQNNESAESDRAQTAPAATGSAKLGRSRSFKYTGNESLRPQTAANTTHSAFDEVLKVAPRGGDFSDELRTQVERQARDGRRVFEALFHNFKTGGIGCQFSAKRPFEVIDISGLASSSLKPMGGSSIKLEDISAMKKKDSIALIFDPTTDTAFAEVTIRVYYQKTVDLLTEQSCSRDYTFCSDGNHFGLELVDEVALARWASLYGTKSTKGGGFGETSPSGRLSPIAPLSPADGPGSPDGAGDTLRSTSAGRRRRERSLPGWQGRPPIFVPSTRCSIEVVSVTPADPSGSASTEYHLSRLRVFAAAGPSLKAAVRKVHEFCDAFFVTDTANLVVTGGISALNLAALHGNLEAVKALVSSGANINARNPESKNHTALHEAVIGGHKEVAKYLLDMGANQLLRDEIGYSPLHHACKLESIALARVLIESESGKRALLLANNSDQKPIELCTSNFMKLRIEGAMRKLKIFVKPRVSILNR